MPTDYLKPGLTLSAGAPNDPAAVRALQRDLRALGYLLRGVDGSFGDQTVRAIRALQNDLLTNQGLSTGKDGRAPVAMTAFNIDAAGHKRVTAITGVLDQPLAQCIAALLADARVVKLPFAGDPKAENAKALAEIAGSVSTVAPTPFISAMIIQESGGQHYHVPGTNDDDRCVTVGLDRNAQGNADAITSRGFGVGQFTLFHHPPRPEELTDYIIDPVRNVQHAFTELRQKFDRFLVGPDSRADDRNAEHPLLNLRLCKYQPGNPLYMRDCKACAQAARKVNITRGTPVYQGAAISYQPDQYYPSAIYNAVPDRADFACDWPYAARRYNGSGNDSFHYQTRILLNLLR